MKILEINKFYCIRGGAESHFFDLTSLLESHGNQVAVFSMELPENVDSKWSKYFVSTVGYTKEYSRRQRIKGIFRPFSFEVKKKLRKILDDVKPDIVHLHNVYGQISLSITKQIKKRQIPVVMTVHDYDLISPDREKYYEHVGKKYWKFLFVKKYSFLKRLLLVAKSYSYDFWGYEKNIDFFVVPSLYVKNILLDAGIETKRIKVIPHFISHDQVPMGKKENLDSKENYAIYFGRISKEKGVKDLVDIFSRKPMNLLLAGRIEGDFEFKDFPKENYLGVLNRSELAKYISKSRFVVSASTLPETFGLIALEAISYGKPFVGLDAGAYGEIVENGKTGFICKNIDEIEQKIDDIISGKVVFDQKKIRQEAIRKYGKEEYYGKIMKVFNSCVK